MAVPHLGKDFGPFPPSSCCGVESGESVDSQAFFWPNLIQTISQPKMGPLNSLSTGGTRVAKFRDPLINCFATRLKMKFEPPFGWG